MNRIRSIILILCAYVFALADVMRFRGPQKRFVIFHTGKLGDLVCVTPIFRAVKESLPDYEVILYARKYCIDILKGNPYVDRVVGYTEDDLSDLQWIVREAGTLRRERPEYFLNLTSNCEANTFGMVAGARKRRGLVTEYDSRIQRALRPLSELAPYRYDRLLKLFYLEMVGSWGIRAHDTRNQLFFEGSLPEAESFFGSRGILEGDTVIGVSVSSGKEFKRWPREHWIELLTMLMQHSDARIIFFGTKSEADEMEAVRSQVPGEHIIMDSLALSELPYYLKRCNLFVSVDTGPLYIADALGVPVVDIFGPCDEQTQRPENRYRIVTNRVKCPPVLKTPSIPLFKKDLSDIDSCFESITVEQVFEACKELLVMG